MRSLKLFIAAILSLLFTLTAFADSTPAFFVTQYKQQSLTPEAALKKLADGNQRFLSGKTRDYPHSANLKIGAQLGQFPFAFIFNCIDSRSIPEMVFDQGVGGLFVGRVAGNVVDTDILASMEFAVKFMGSKIIVVMGHTSCGAIAGACANVQIGNLTSLLAKVKPAVKITEVQLNNKNCQDPKLIDAIAKENVLLQLNQVYRNSKIIRDLVDKNNIDLVGAMQDIKTGKVTFFDRSGKSI